jgi:hypothetical protein
MPRHLHRLRRDVMRGGAAHAARVASLRVSRIAARIGGVMVKKNIWHRNNGASNQSASA